jgi:hypothetical protein
MLVCIRSTFDYWVMFDGSHIYAMAKTWMCHLRERGFEPCDHNSINQAINNRGVS